MAKREFTYTAGKGGPKVVEVPRHLRGRSEYDAGTYTENVIARRAGEAAGALVRGLFGGKSR
ncbi:hypothetical protein ACQP2F_00445 [Actinoplanes sp. CA-030573]|uniref:hypothetical protein n=1 Tax=Actinoplanes sp. CA-030573 TaxID=3239898 RepID=UPI003D92F8C5